jgi:hypothetical protein
MLLNEGTTRNAFARDQTNAKPFSISNFLVLASFRPGWRLFGPHLVHVDGADRFVFVYSPDGLGEHVRN